MSNDRQPKHWQVTRTDVGLEGRMAKGHGEVGFQTQVVVFAETMEQALAQGAALLSCSPTRLRAQRFVAGSPLGG